MFETSPGLPGDGGLVLRAPTFRVRVSGTCPAGGTQDFDLDSSSASSGGTGRYDWHLPTEAGCLEFDDWAVDLATTGTVKLVGPSGTPPPVSTDATLSGIAVNDGSAGAGVAYLDADGNPLDDADTTEDGFQVALAEGANVITVRVTAEDDTTVQDYTVMVTLGAGAGTGYTVGDPATATVAVTDNDVPVDFVLSVPATVAEDGGTATSGDDYGAVSESVFIQPSEFMAATVDGQPRFQAAWTYDVTIIDDVAVEGDETLVLAISRQPRGRSGLRTATRATS